MGTRMIPPPAGDDCWCHPETEYTPQIIFVYFWNLIQCPGRPVPPNGHLFSCFQDDVDPCKWANVHSSFGWEVALFYFCGSDQTAIYLGYDGNPNYYQGLHNGFVAEHTVFPNTWSACNGIYGAHSGFATLFWLEAATDILTLMALPNDGHTFMEFFMNADNKPIYKFCNKRWLLNQKFLYDP